LLFFIRLLQGRSPCESSKRYQPVTTSAADSGDVLITLAALWRLSLFSKTAPAYYRAFVVPNTKAFKIIVLQSQREHRCHLPQKEALPKSGHERSWFSSLRMACTSVADNAEHIWMLLTRCNVETVTGGHLT
jgi:hypothetical protein